MKKLTTKITMLFALFFVLAFVPGMKAEAYGVDQVGATATDVTIVWSQDTSSYCIGYYVLVNGTQVSQLLPTTTTTYTIPGLSAGTPYFVEIAEMYQYSDGEQKAYSGGSKIVRTAPTKVGEVAVQWTKSDYVTIAAMDPNAYVYDNSPRIYADGYEIVIKDKNGKVRKTISDGYNWTIYLGLKESFNAPSKIKNKGMIYTITPYITLDNGVRVLGESVTKVAVPQAKISKIKSYGGSTYTITWKKVSGAKGYTIYRVKSDDEGNWTQTKKIKKVSKNTTSYAIKKTYMNSRKKGVMVIANGVKIKGKKYNSTKSYYTYTY